MDALLLALGLALPWGMGIALLAALPAERGEALGTGELPWLLGYGWFVGMFLLTLWMRVLARLGVPLGLVAIAGPLTVATAVLAWIAWRTRRPRFSDGIRASGRAVLAVDLQSWRRILWLVLLGWLAVRFALLLAEVWWRPLYPWDAWEQWATKARVWFGLKTMVPFVGAGEWLHAAPGVYHDTAPNYPATVPLFQVWSATLLGRWDDALINLPWWLTAVAFAFALFGALRRLSFDALQALVGTWLVVSLPILETHVALAGYADLPMATYLTLGVLPLLRWAETRRWPDAAVALLLLAACITIKNPGIVWVLTLAPGLAVALWGRNGLRLAAVALGIAVITVLLLARSEVVLLGYHLHLDFAPPVHGLFEAFFTFANWHLLWYGALAGAMLGRRHLLARELAPLTIVIVAGLGFLMVGFAFTNAGHWVEDQSTVNRATLHLAPLVGIWMLLVFRAWAGGVGHPRIPSPGTTDTLAT
jgi:hypothetical protein